MPVYNDLLYHLTDKRRTDNKPLRMAIVTNGVFMYEVAARLGVDESTFHRWLRWELPDERKAAILRAAQDLAEEHGRKGADVLQTYKDFMALQTAKTAPPPWEK